MEETASKVAYCVQVATAPNSEGAARLEASKFYNDYINSAPPGDLIQVGFLLTSHSDLIVVRTGLQIVEKVAQFNWQMVQDREQVKDKLFLLMQNPIYTAETCPSFLQEALARVIVEIAKREWPQLWPNLFPKLFEIASSSDLALLVLRRMVEDVVTLQTVDCQERRRELSQSLNAIATDVISTFFRVLTESVKQYHSTTAMVYQKRAKVCLSCLLPYIEWTIPTIFANEEMIGTLFALLPDFYFQMSAADCILQLVERKSKNRFEISEICLKDSVFKHFLASVETARPQNFDLLRKLGEILVSLSSSVAVGKVKFENFLVGCEKLGSREEAVAVVGSASAINHLIKASEKDSSVVPAAFAGEFDKCLVRLSSLILQKFITAAPNSVEREEMTRLKLEYSTLLRTVGKRVPSLYKEVNGWLRNALDTPTAVQAHQWDALSIVIDAIASTVSHEDVEMIRIGLQDLLTCHSKFVSEANPDLRSLILSIVSGLFVFLSLVQKRGEFGPEQHQMTKTILDSMFRCFELEAVVGVPGGEAIRDLRRHASSLMIKLATKYPEVMVLVFDHLHSSASVYAPKLSTMEYTNVLECLLIVSNMWSDFGKQSALIGSLFSAQDWAQISQIAETHESFVAIFNESVFQDKRVLILKNLHTVHSTLRRVKKLAGKNGVSNGVGDGQLQVSSGHPAFDHICPLLPIILKLVKGMHSLINSAELSYVQDLSEAERTQILGIYHGHTNEPKEEKEGKTHNDRIKTFVLSIQELTYGILGETCTAFGSRFYSIPQLADAFLSFVAYNGHLLNDFRLRGLLKNVFKSFLIQCPPSLAATVIVPFAQRFFPFMADRLASRWTVIENANLAETEATEEQEVLENSSLRLLTKEYLELISKILEKSSTSASPSGETMPSSQSSLAEVDMVDNSAEMESNASQANSSTQEIGELGAILLSDPTCFNTIVSCLVSCICWDDSTACLRASRCLLLLLDRILSHPEMAKGMFVTVLRAVCIWHENETTLDPLLKIADTSFKSCYAQDPQYALLLTQWGAPTQDIQKLSALCQSPKNEKKRKEIWRKLVHNNPSIEKNKCPKSQWLKGLPQLKLNADGNPGFSSSLLYSPK